MAEKEELERSIAQLQNFERQLQAVLLQKQQLQIQLNETSLALEELGKATGEVYRTVGSVMMKTTKEQAEKDLNEKKELMEKRVQTLSQQEEKVKNEILRLQKLLKAELGSGESA